MVLGQRARGAVQHRREPTLNSPEQMDIGSRTASSITLGFDHACIVFDDATIALLGRERVGRHQRWSNRLPEPAVARQHGRLPRQRHRGHTRTAAARRDIDVGAGRTVLTASAGDTTTCALLDNLTVRCWGIGPDRRAGDHDRGRRRRDSWRCPRDQLQRRPQVRPAVTRTHPRHPTRPPRARGKPEGSRFAPTVRSTCRSPERAESPTPACTPSS